MLRSNPSADPGAKIEGRAAFVKHDAAHLPLRDWHESENPSRPEAAIHRQDAALSLANTKRSQFQFTVNQDTTYLQIPACLSISARFMRMNTIWHANLAGSLYLSEGGQIS